MRNFALAFALFCFGTALAGCKGGHGGGGGGGTTIDVSPSSIQLQAGGVQQFTANVHHAHGSQGVTWSLSSSACNGAACGTLDSSSANPVTYTAPTPPPPSNLAITLTATSAADASASASANITVLALSVSLSPSSASVSVGAMQSFTATVSSDNTNSGVTWTLTQGGTACAPACGSLSAANSASNTPITYTAPSTVPASAAVTLTATSVAEPAKSATATITITTTAAACGTGSESLLSGQYAFLVQGFDSNGPAAIAGSFSADGTGGITAGGEDVNRTSGAQKNLTIFSSSSSQSAYSVGPDHRGCLTLVNSAGTTTVFRFALGSIGGTPALAFAGQIIEFDDANATGTRGSGIIRRQDAASFAGGLSGTYAFGVSGNDSTGARFAIAGTVQASAGNFSNGNADADSSGGATASNVVCAACGTYTALDMNGRGTSRFAFPAPLVSVDFAFYQVSASEALFMSTDAIASAPIQSGEALLETGAGSFSTASLSASSAFHLEGFGGKGTNSPTMTIGLITVPSSGNFALIIDEDMGGTSTNNTPISGTYSIAANGRAVLTATSGGAHHVPILYLVDANTGFLVGTGGSAELGFLEPQVGVNFGNTSLNSGLYSFGTEIPTGNAVVMQSGTFTVNNATATFSGEADSSGTGGLTHDQSISGSYSITSNGTGTFGSNGVLVIISSSKFIFIDENAGANPSVTIVEQ